LVKVKKETGDENIIGDALNSKNNKKKKKISCGSC